MDISEFVADRRLWNCGADSKTPLPEALSLNKSTFLLKGRLSIDYVNKIGKFEGV